MTDDSDIRWGLAQRLEFIEWRAFWNGRVNRKDLEQRFQISTPQASADFSRYQATAPHNITYDKGERTFVTKADFRPKYLRLSPERYLRQLEAIHSEAIQKIDTWFDELPPADVVPAMARGPEAYVLRAIVNAIRRGEVVNIYYQSLTRTGSREICPHALAYDGARWHVRAMSIEHGEFRDFVLGRILSVGNPREYDPHPEHDLEWSTFGTLKLAPHPGLSGAQRKTIEHDFRFVRGSLAIPMRLALSYYFIRRHNLDLRQGEIPPARAQLFLQNYDEIIQSCETTKQKSKALIAKQTVLSP